MATDRADIIDWCDQGRLPPAQLRAAMETAGVLPDAAQWRRFLDRTLLFMGVVMLAAGVIFFFAFNWAELGRASRFALIELPILVLLGALWKVGVDGVAGRALLLLASLLAGGLLALVGQTYQTGADSWELFAAWSAAILPWVLVARFPALWMFWLALLNVALALYFLTFGFLWGMLFAPEKLLWLLFGLNTLALVAWEALVCFDVQWLRERWAIRLLAVTSGGLITALGVHDILEWRLSAHWGAPLWCAWMVAAYVFYRRLQRDLFVLAGGVLSFVVMTTVLIAKGIRFSDASALLFLGLVVIALSSAGGYWLKQVAVGEDA